MILLRVMVICFLPCMMLASDEVHAQDRADQLKHSGTVAGPCA